MAFKRRLAHDPYQNSAGLAFNAPDLATTAGTSETWQKADGMLTLGAPTYDSTAYPVAAKLTAASGLRGFRLNLAVEAAGDLDQLKELALRIRQAVAVEKY